MNRFAEPTRRFLPHTLVALAFGSYAVVFTGYHDRIGAGLASLATIPVVAASWFFGTRGGVSFAILTTVTSGYILSLGGESLPDVFTEPGNILRVISLFLVAIVTGRLSNISSGRIDAFRTLESYEKQRRLHTDFLEILNGITSKALKADNLQSTLEILTEQITKLFKADDGYFSFWDSEREVSIPKVAYGSMRGEYPHMHFEPGEQTLTKSVMEAERPIPVPDVRNSPYISPRVASLFPSRSRLGVPLIAEGRKLGVLVLGYMDRHEFDDNEIANAGMLAEQLALVLSKSQLLEEERKQVKQLTALHDVALTTIEADDIDQLIERVTGIIGKNLFPDNFGILLLDENEALLRVHPSYRFLATDKITIREVPLGRGITGEVAKSGKSQRLGNVRMNPQYLDVDDRIASELCVPIKFKERILGVINAESVAKDAFTHDDERLMITLAGQLATAIEQLRTTQTEREWMDHLTRSNELIYALAHITTHIEKALTADEIIRVLGEELNKIKLTSVIALHDVDHGTFTINQISMDPPVLEYMESRIGFPLLEHTIFMDRLLSVLEAPVSIYDPALIANPENEIQVFFERERRHDISEILQGIGITSSVKLVRLPLVIEESLLGILWLWGEGASRSDLPILSLFAKQVSTSLERARLFQEVQNLAITDPLTGLHNRRSLYELGKIEFARADRFHRPYSCLMLDIDHFKQINDSHGHHAGDLVLQEFARLCRKSVRDIDLVGRYGGEELLILMPETSIERAINVAERLRLNVAGYPIPSAGAEITITASIGVAARDENTPDLETLIARADQAMYIAKHRGRNRVAVSK